MALNLSELKFVVDDSDLKRASDTIGNLVTNVGKLDKAARDAAQTEATLARAAKLNADANLQNAKAQDVRLKSTITADKADQQAAAAIERKTKATDRASTAIKKNADMLQLQNDTYDFILEGFSRGDAKVLAMAKATGQLSDQLKQVLTDIRQFSKNTFDQTETGLDRMVKSAKEASSAQGFLNNGLNLTSKQAKELSNDLDRLNIRLQHQGKSYQEITKEQAIYKQRFVEEANAVNRATSALAVVEKQRKDVVSATNYLTQADAKMAAALNTSNAALDKAGTDSLVNYETALRKSGISQDVATAKLAKYKAQLEQVQIQEQKRREEHLTRALAPQATDVVVSLWSGQNPLTVLLQQGGQVTDLFMRSGVAAEKFGEVVKSSMKSMLPSILTVAKGIGGLLVDGFMAAGNATKGFIADIFGVAGAMDKLYMKMSENGPSKWGGAIQGLSSLITGGFAVGIAVVVAGLVGLGIGLKQVIEENDNLARSMAQSGASMAISTSQAFAYAKSMNDVDISTGKAVVAITEMVKAGNFASSDIPKVTEAAVNLNKYLGVSIEDTVKAYSKLKDEPVKAILDLAKASGNIPPKIIETIVELERQGEVAKATSIAMTARFENDKKVIEDAKKNLSGFSTFVIKLGETISNFFSDAFKNIWYATDPADELQKHLDEVRKRIKDVSATLESNKSWGISGDPKLLNSLKEQERMIISQIGAQVRLRGEEEKRKFLNAENAKYESAVADLRGNALDTIEKETRKTQTLADFRRKFVEDKLKDAAREKAVDLEKLKQNKDLVSLLEKQADIEYKKTQKSGSKSENYFATIMREATNASIKADDATKSLTASQVKLLETVKDPRFLELSKVKQEIYLSTMAANAGKEQQIALTDAQAEAEERLLKLLGKSSGIGRQYYTDMANMEKDAALLGKSREEIEELTRAIFMATPAWQKYQKALEDVNSAARKFNEDSLASQAATLKENESLDYRLSLLGKTAEEQRALSIEYNRANKISEVRIKLAKQLRDIEADIEKAKKDGLPEEKYKNLIDAQGQARKDAAEQEKVINREVAVQYKEDFQKEFDAIKNGISDSIVTALFEGGKAGSKKLRNLVVAELRKPVTMVVNAVVNTLLGGVMSSFTTSMMGGGGELLGSISSLSGLASTANNLYSAITGGFANLSGSIATQVQSGLNFLTGSGGMISQGPIQVGGLAQGIGSVAAPLLGAYGGISAGRLIGGGYSLNGGSGNSTINMGTAVGSFFGPLGALAGGAIGGAANRLFGRKLKAAGIEGTFGGETGFEGNRFEYYKGGTFRSDKTKRSPLDEETRSNFAKSFLDMKDGVSEMAKMLGLGTESLESFTYKFKVNLKGLSEEDATKKIQEQFKLMGEEMAKFVLKTDEYSLAEETRMDTLIRLSSTLSTVNTIFENMGMTMYDISLTGADAAYELSQLFGGLGQFTSVMSNYYDKFYSAEEQRANVQKQLAKSFKELGLSMIDIDATDARQQFRGLVEAQDLTTESGRKAYAALLAISGTFASVTTEVTGSITTVADALSELRNATRSVEDIAQNILSLEQALFEAQNSGNIEVLRNKILQGLTEQERILQRQLWAIEDTRTAQEKLVSAYKGQVTALDSSINRLRTYSDSLKKFKDSLTLGELSPLTPSEQYAEAKRQYESNLALAMVGDVGAQDALQGSITAFLQASRTYNASSSQYTSDFKTAQAGLDFIASITQDQANNEQILRDAAVSQLELLGSIDESVTAVGELISSGLIELSNAILTGLSLGITSNQGVLDAVNNGLAGGQSSYYNSLPTTTSQSNQPIAIVPVNQTSAMQSNSQGLVSLNSQLVEEVRNLTAQVILLRSERQQDTRSQTQILAAATTEAGTAVTEAINKSNYIQQVVTGVKLI